MTNKHRYAGIPRWIALPAACAVLFLLVPFIALLIRIDWVQFPHLFSQALSSQALALSLRTCLASTLACIIVGLPLALVCARARDTWWSRVLRSMVTLPMVLPPVVAGLALLITWGRRGLIGAYLQIFGINIAFTTVAVVMAQTFVSLPFFVSSLEGALRTRGFNEERVASGLGASPSRTLWSVTLPLMIPALVSSTALAFSRALGEFGATITFAGSLAGVTRTLPLEIYLQREESTDMALMLSVILVFVALVLVGGASAFSQWWYSRLLSGTSADEAKAPTASRLATEHSRGLGNKDGEAQGQLPRVPVPGVRIAGTLPERHINVDLTCQGGVVTALMGHNGAGKSTLLSVLSGALDAPQMTCTWQWPDGISGRQPKIAVLEQKPVLFPHMSLLANVAFPLRCAGISPAEAEVRAREALESVGLAGLEQRRPAQVSGGQAQRTALARALVVAPEVLLLDEPMAALDVEAARGLRELIAQRFLGRTVIMVTHQIEDAAALDAHIIVLKGGRLLREGLWRELINQSISHADESDSALLAMGLSALERALGQE
ncbi:ABC transporter permease [Actinomyces sp. oral taxon 181]|uniref:ABC transporter permease n=1 Tax=Actinomyces sp. oral taxon 181 TaxID=712121 RepID=UPI0002A45654|nr:ABC transporter permease [Actinomyces sp. oral taxon 181]EKY14158.1 molybdate ABC transporter, permease protein [Actinomyces sp. oral taxon 181 str. F0379]